MGKRSIYWSVIPAGPMHTFVWGLCFPPKINDNGLYDPFYWMGALI